MRILTLVIFVCSLSLNAQDTDSTTAIFDSFRMKNRWSVNLNSTFSYRMWENGRVSAPDTASIIVQKDKFRIVSNNRVTYCDGKYMYEMDRKSFRYEFENLIVTKASPFIPIDFFVMNLSDYQTTPMSVINCNGKECLQINAHRKLRDDNFPYKIKLVFDRKEHHLERAVVYYPEGIVLELNIMAWENKDTFYPAYCFQFNPDLPEYSLQKVK